MATCNCVGPQNGEPLCPCMMRVAHSAVKQVLLNNFYMGILTDSDMFKYTPAYTGGAWNNVPPAKGGG